MRVQDARDKDYILLEMVTENSTDRRLDKCDFRNTASNWNKYALTIVHAFIS